MVILHQAVQMARQPGKREWEVLVRKSHNYKNGKSASEFPLRKATRLNLPAVTLRISYSIGMPDNVSKITAMASGILSHLNHWAICKPGGKQPGKQIPQKTPCCFSSPVIFVYCLPFSPFFRTKFEILVWCCFGAYTFRQRKHCCLFQKQVPLVRNVERWFLPQVVRAKKHGPTAISMQGEITRNEWKIPCFRNHKRLRRVPWSARRGA